MALKFYDIRQCRNHMTCGVADAMWYHGNNYTGRAGQILNKDNKTLRGSDGKGKHNWNEFGPGVHWELTLGEKEQNDATKRGL